MDSTEDLTEPLDPAPLRGLRYRRRMDELSQNEVAARLGILQATYSKLERGLTDPKLSHMLKLARLFRCRVDDLL